MESVGKRKVDSQMLGVGSGVEAFTETGNTQRGVGFGMLRNSHLATLFDDIDDVCLDDTD